MKVYMITLAIFAALFVVALIAIRVLRKRYYEDDARLEAILKAEEICEKLLQQVALALFTEAERKYGSGTGQLKFSTVMAQFLAMLPDWVKECVDTDWLAERLEALLDEAKELWEKNDKLVG